MFCTQCGTQLPDNAKFCFSCGAQLGGASGAAAQGHISANVGTKFVDAKCTNCGAKLEVDPNMKKASCSYCGAEFLVEQAINNYNIQVSGNMNIGMATINVQGGDKKNLLARARAFEEGNELEEALEYYNRVLDIDFNDTEANNGRDRSKKKIEWYRLGTSAESQFLWDEALFYYNQIIDLDAIYSINNKEIKSKREMMEQLLQDYVYFDEVIPGIFSDDHLQVKNNSLSVIDSKGKETIYYFDKMSKVTTGFGGTFTFNYPDKWAGVVVGGARGKEIVEFINNAMNGKLPTLREINEKV